jgi:hypothetical protein
MISKDNEGVRKEKEGRLMSGRRNGILEGRGKSR